jgi:tRNA (Thr-GGU) A37 N-methylase
VSTEPPFFAFAEVAYGSDSFEIVPFSHQYERHLEIASHLSAAFPDAVEGIQSCSHINLLVFGQAVSVDNFWSWRHQVKSASDGEHVTRVIEVLAEKYRVVRYSRPREGGYEDSEIDLSGRE